MRTRTLLAPQSLRTAGVLIASALALTACGSGDTGAQPDPASDTEAQAITVTDAWIKAAEEGMTSAFGLVENSGEAEVTLVAVETEASPETELHRTTTDGSGGMSMEEQEGGFPIPAGETLILEPGAEHIMLMDLPEPLESGATAGLTLVFSDDSELDVTAEIREFAGAQEDYGGMEEGDEGEHAEHSEHSTGADQDDGSGQEHSEHDGDEDHQDDGSGHGGHSGHEGGGHESEDSE